MSDVIPPELQRFVQEQVASGAYPSAEDVLADGLRLLQELRRRQAEFRQAVQQGLDELERGEGIVVEEDALRAFFDDVQSRGRARYEKAVSRS